MCSEVLLCWPWSGERTGWHGTSRGRLPLSSWVLAGSFLLALKGAEQLPQLFFSIIDATWKGSGVLAGRSCPEEKGVGSGAACASATCWEEETAAMQLWMAYGSHPQLLWPSSR